MTQPDPKPEPIRRGDTTAFDGFYDLYARRVMGYLLRLTHSARDAEDLTQDTFIAAFQQRQQYARRGRPLAWLLGIAWRRWRDGSRRANAANGTLPLTDTHVAPGDFAHDARERATLQEALQSLSEPERNALLLTAVQGLTYKEAAQVMGEPVGTVKWHVHSATRKLRVLLQDVSEVQTELECAQKIETETNHESKTNIEQNRRHARIAHASGRR